MSEAAGDGIAAVAVWLTAQDGYVTADQIAAGAGQPAEAVRAALDALGVAGRLETRRDRYGSLYRLTPRPAPPGTGVCVEVDAGDLEYLLAHYLDEISGHPDRSHWRLPLLAQACGRLYAAVREPS